MAIKPFFDQVRFMAYFISLKFMCKNFVFNLLYYRPDGYDPAD